MLIANDDQNKISLIASLAIPALSLSAGLVKLLPI